MQKLFLFLWQQNADTTANLEKSMNNKFVIHEVGKMKEPFLICHW